MDDDNINKICQKITSKIKKYTYNLHYKPLNKEELDNLALFLDSLNDKDTKEYSSIILAFNLVIRYNVDYGKILFNAKEFGADYKNTVNNINMFRKWFAFNDHTYLVNFCKKKIDKLINNFSINSNDIQVIDAADIASKYIKYKGDYDIISDKYPYPLKLDKILILSLRKVVGKLETFKINITRDYSRKLSKNPKYTKLELKIMKGYSITEEEFDYLEKWLDDYESMANLGIENIESLDKIIDEVGLTVEI